MDKTAGCIINPGSFIMYVYGGYKSGVKRDGADNIYSDWMKQRGQNQTRQAHFRHAASVQQPRQTTDRQEIFHFHMMFSSAPVTSANTSRGQAGTVPVARLRESWLLWEAEDKDVSSQTFLSLNLLWFATLPYLPPVREVDLALTQKTVLCSATVAQKNKSHPVDSCASFD